LISKCFLSRDVTSLVKAFETYVRPRLEYCSVAWNPSLNKDIESLGKVQRRFTERLPGLHRLTHCQRLSNLLLVSLELLDLTFTHKLVFGLTDVNLDDFLDYPVTTEIADIGLNTNCSDEAAVLVQDTTNKNME